MARPTSRATAKGGGPTARCAGADTPRVATHAPEASSQAAVMGRPDDGLPTAHRAKPKAMTFTVGKPLDGTAGACKHQIRPRAAAA